MPFLADSIVLWWPVMTSMTWTSMYPITSSSLGTIMELVWSYFLKEFSRMHVAVRHQYCSNYRLPCFPNHWLFPVSIGPLPTPSEWASTDKRNVATPKFPRFEVWINQIIVNRGYKPFAALFFRHNIWCLGAQYMPLKAYCTRKVHTYWKWVTMTPQVSNITTLALV